MFLRYVEIVRNIYIYRLPKMLKKKKNLAISAMGLPQLPKYFIYIRGKGTQGDTTMEVEAQLYSYNSGIGK